MRNYISLMCAVLLLSGCQSTQNIQLSLTLPPGYKLLPSARRSFVVYDEGKRVKSFFIQVPEQVFKAKKGSSDRNAMAKVYYCPIGSEGMCIIHDTFFKFDGTEDNVSLRYTLPEGR